MENTILALVERLQALRWAYKAAKAALNTVKSTAPAVEYFEARKRFDAANAEALAETVTLIFALLRQDEVRRELSPSGKKAVLALVDAVDRGVKRPNIVFALGAIDGALAKIATREKRVVTVMGADKAPIADTSGVRDLLK